MRQRSTLEAIPLTNIIYPDGEGHFALDSPDGRTLQQSEIVEISLGGFWIPGAVTWNHNGDYFTALFDKTVCGLCARMQVRPFQNEVLIADRDKQQGKEAL